MKSQTNNNMPPPATAVPPPLPPPPEQSPAEQEEELRLQNIFRLVSDRAVGRATNEQVEAAIAAALGDSSSNGGNNNTAAPSKQKKPPPVPQTQQQQQPTIDADTGNYDDDDDDSEEEGAKKPAASVRSTRTSLRGTTTTTAKAELPQPQPQPPASKKRKTKASQISYETIPLGRQGAQMMQTFGDGPKPTLVTVTAALQGARRKLQVAIQDARSVRRHDRATYLQARATLQVDKPRKPVELQNCWSSAIMFRAAAGHDALTYNHAAGFDVEQLQHLFPQEMNCYSKWSELRAAAAEKKDADDQAATTAAGANEDSTNTTTDTAETANAAANTDDDDNNNHDNNDNLMVEGHMQVRAAHFDVRTDGMRTDGYLKFAVVRQGSFLPSNSKLSAQEIAWNKQKKPVKGRKASGVWQHMSATQVRFLHWIGFDPQSALPPPNDATAAALGFLGYDFFGRIVEKAIFLRNLAALKADCANGESVDERTVPMELSSGEQLQPSDIERAMEDSDILPVPLYGASQDEKKMVKPQLYFGPGFEDRLEMELEEYVVLVAVVLSLKSIMRFTHSLLPLLVVLSE